MKHFCIGFFAATIVFCGISPAVNAEVFHGVEFPGGAASFADHVVSFEPVIKSGEPTAPYLDPNEALGIPDYPEGSGEDYVSLGDGGAITLKFTDNSLTGSGSTAFDLWIFEVGADIEDTYVEISKNGVLWFSVGKVFGSTSGIDIDAYGFGPADFFSYVRLIDDENQGGQTGNSVGADIDAVGAIFSGPPVSEVPEPCTLILFTIGGIGLAFFRARGSASGHKSTRTS